MLIAARVVTGAGAALLLPASLAIVRVVWPEQTTRRRVLGIWASCNGLAFVVGPTIGGLLIEHLGWPSVFLLSVPLALVALAIAALTIREFADPQDRRLDLPGQLTGAAILGGLAFAAIDSHRGGHAWMFSLVLSMPATSLCFLAAERQAGQAALVPLELFRNRPFCGALVATASMTFGIYGMIFLLPLVWQASGLLGPETAGLALLPCALIFFLVSQRSGHLAQCIGVRVMTAGGTAVIGCGLLVLAASAGQPLALAAVGLALTGIGMGLNTGPLMSVAVEAVTAARSGTASALINVARMVGATLGVAFLGAAFALCHDGESGLRAAMLAGGSVQLWGP